MAHPTADNLAETGWTVVPNVALDEDNAALLALGRSLGRISAQGNHHGAPNLEAAGVNRVQAMDAPMHDSAGNPILSTAAAEFALHTDDSFSPQPARYVLMHCWRSDPAGGESWLAHVEDILAQLSPALVQRLHEQAVPTPFGQATVLFKAGDAAPGIRFNRRDMLGFGVLRKSPLPAQQMADLLAVESAAMACLQRTTLAPGDCIVVDNQHMLHGRSAFHPKSGRLLKRLRVA